MRTTMAAAAPWPSALALNRAGATADSVTEPVAPATWKVAGPVFRPAGTTAFTWPGETK